MTRRKADSDPLLFAQPKFHGESYDTQLDYERLTSLLGRVFTLMEDGEWRTLDQIQGMTGGSTQGISMRLRDYRSSRCGSHTLFKRRTGDPKAGVWEYQLIVK